MVGIDIAFGRLKGHGKCFMSSGDMGSALVSTSPKRCRRVVASHTHDKDMVRMVISEV